MVIIAYFYMQSTFILGKSSFYSGKFGNKGIHYFEKLNCNVNIYDLTISTEF
jgi:hypothetical protein